MAKILVVDDECDGKGVLERYLTSSGNTVTAARTALGALAWLDREEFDVMVIDVSGRGQIRALAVCRILKSDPRTMGTRVLFLSDVVDVESKAVAAGADAFLAKPYCFAEIDSQLYALINQSKAGQPVMSGISVHESIRAYSVGMLGWARSPI